MKTPPKVQPKRESVIGIPKTQSKVYRSAGRHSLDLRAARGGVFGLEPRWQTLYRRSK